MKKEEKTSTSEANIEMNEAFYGKEDHPKDYSAPYYLQGGGTPILNSADDKE
ncbi:hypothetical protein LCM10_10870 [Rossellomorea aquimaris]|uniref:hypothetical protein n=1 Tax=Rossellomorea aquimaris TaxID=189382 RepID=UPI001CD4B718|nr:hypothetical protein [Rossellomorea aquimaris]MCA1055486.1 hypothetical protein [Rossellomorea aquimaris]